MLAMMHNIIWWS